MPEFINLQLGWPSPSLFPAAQLLKGASDVLQTPEKVAAALVYGPDPGYQPLRESIARWLTSTYSPTEAISPTRISISHGASGCLANILSKFTDPNYTQRIWMVEPSYFMACPIFADAGFEGRLRGVPEDDEGLDVEFLRANLAKTAAEEPQAPARIKNGAWYGKIYKNVIYAVPTFANPSGKTMSYRRRQELVRIAREFDCLVITDDVYDILRWPAEKEVDTTTLGPIPPRIVDIDKVLDGGPKDEWGNAVSNGSFSKIIAPGIRTGWVEATPSFIHGLSKVGATYSGGCPSQIAASFVHEMIETGKLQAHIRDTLIPVYRSRHYALMEAVRTNLVPLGFAMSTGKPYAVPANDSGHVNGSLENVAVAGGYFTYVLIPANLPITARELAAMALEKYNLKFAFGDMMKVEGDDGCTQRAAEGFGRGIRLCWAWHTEAEIAEGIQRLAALATEVQQGSHA